MSDIILPNDSNRDPLIMGDPYANALTPKLAQQKRNQEFDQIRKDTLSKTGETWPGYANSAVAYHPDPWLKTAQMSGVSNIMTQPMWFSPMHTPQSWQTASKRREVYQWNRFFLENEPKVGAAISFYAEFPMNGFKLECPSRKVMNWFKHHVVDRLQLNDKFKMISREYFTLGDVFVHMDVDCPTCSGSGVDPDTGEQCNHGGGSFKRMVILNPDWIEVQQSILADEPAIVMIPDEELKRIVFYKQPKVVYDRIPDRVKELVLSNKPIPLSNRTVSHLRHMPVPYGTYGTSLIRRLFTTLAYKTKIMTANWIVAERLILPVRVVKIGSDTRPATTADIADVQQQLAATANDPNLTIVTHHNFEYEWYGASGKILQVTQEMEFIGKEILDGFMLNQSLLNGEMSGYQCYDQDTKVLTKDGWKRYENVTDDDEIMVFDPNKNYMFYEKPKARFEKHYTGDMIHFSGNKVDILVTPNHKILYYKQDKKQHFMSDAKAIYEKVSNYESRDHSRVYFRSVSEWKCSNKIPTINLAGHEIPLDPFLEFAGYYLSEGYCSNGNRCSFSQSETANPEKCSDIEKFVNKLKDIPFKKYAYEHKATEWCICQKKFASQISDWFGTNSSNKKIPAFIKNLPVEKLQILINALMNGDASKYEYKTTDAIQLGSNSYQLIEDVAEILFKMNLAPVISQYRKAKQYLLYCNMQTNGKGRMPKIKKQHAKIMHYDGKVWCFTTSTGFFVTMRNGKISIQGNSAQVGVETLIRRIESWRGTLAEWCEQNIFKPIAEMQGFIDHKKSEEIGELCFMYPTIKWNDLNLKDPNPWYQILMQLHDKQVISTQTLMEEMDLDYDQEVKRMRYETSQGTLGQGMQPGAGGGMGGGAGGMPGAGGAGGAGGMDMGGPMGPAGAGLGGDMGAGGGMMGGAGAGGAGGMGPMASGGKIMKKGKQKEAKPEEMMMQMPQIKLTDIEQKMAAILTDVASVNKLNANSIRVQYPVANPQGGKSYVLDFAIPNLKIGVETDGEVWHGQPEQEESDQERDSLLAQRGWTILRFDDRTVDDAPQAIKQQVSTYVEKAMHGEKKASSNVEFHMYTMSRDQLIEVPTNLFWWKRTKSYRTSI